MSRGRAQVGCRPVLRHQMRRMLKAGRKKSRESDFYHRSDELSEGGQSCLDDMADPLKLINEELIENLIAAIFLQYSCKIAVSNFNAPGRCY